LARKIGGLQEYVVNDHQQQRNMANGTAMIDNPLSLNALPEPEDGGPLPRRLAAKVGSMTQPLKFAGIVSDPYPPLLFLN
jgi:hypothetical protein